MRTRAFGVVGVLLLAACAPALERTEPPAGPRAVLWQDPEGRNDLFFGAGGRALAPDPDATYELLERDPSGFSTTLDIRDASGLEWSAKLGPEAQTEVVASRILWAAGYQQPPAYYVPHLIVERDGRVTNEGAARMRPEVEWLDDRDSWSWHRNPFVGTQEFRGLRVLMAILNSTDLKDDNNEIFVSTRDGGRPEAWYVVKDLGASLGDTGRFSPERGDVELFERHPFITKVAGSRVEFAFKGRHGELLEGLTVEDVRWISVRLSRLTDEQWREAFRAGGYSTSVTERYIRQLKAKIDAGQALRPQETTP